MRQLPAKGTLLVKARPRRESWDRNFRPSNVEPAGPGEQSVWDYPRPPVLAASAECIRVLLAGQIIAESCAVLELRETASAPVPYLPPRDVRTEWLVANGRVSVCEWKGAALSHDLVLPGGARIADAAWCYPDPFDDLPQGYEKIAGWFAFYPAKVDCFVGRERARPQPGGFYGGWMTSRIRGPVKGAPGSSHW